MQKKYFLAVAALFITVVSMAFILNNDSKDETQTSLQQSATPVVFASGDSTQSFKWYTVTEALELQKTSGKKIFIDVYTTWCGPCKMLDANTFSNTTIRNLLSEYYIPTKFNAESADTIVFQEKTFTNPNYSPQPRKSTHDFAIYIASTQQGLGYPTMVFLNEKQEMLQPIAGYLTPQQLEPILSFFGSDAYKTTDWQTYFSNFKSSITQ